MANENFFTVLEDGLQRNGWTCVRLFEEMKSKGYKITVRSLQRYRRQETKPNHKVAKWIFTCLGVDVPDTEIDTLLENCEKSADYEFGDARYIKRGIRLRVDRLSVALDDETQILAALKKRIYDTQELDKPNLNRYLTMLIQKDIDEHILPKATKRRRKNAKKS